MTRYFFNIKTHQFLQLSGLIAQQPFNDDWLEITKWTYDRLMEASNAA